MMPKSGGWYGEYQRHSEAAIKGKMRDTPLERSQNNPIWNYLYVQKAPPRKLSFTNNYKEKVTPTIEVLNVADVLNRAQLNYGPEESPREQPYIERRLIPFMRTTKLTLPEIEVYNEGFSNARPHLPTGKRPFTNIFIVDGAHRIVALQKLGLTEIPFLVYREPKTK